MAVSILLLLYITRLTAGHIRTLYHGLFSQIASNHTLPSSGPGLYPLTPNVLASTPLPKVEPMEYRAVASRSTSVQSRAGSVQPRQRLDRTLYPQIKFWTKRDIAMFRKTSNTSIGRASSVMTNNLNSDDELEDVIEDDADITEDGQPGAPTAAKAIGWLQHQSGRFYSIDDSAAVKATARDAFETQFPPRTALPCYKKISPAVKSWMIDYMMRAHPELALCEKDVKANTVMSSIWWSWCNQHRKNELDEAQQTRSKSKRKAEVPISSEPLAKRAQTVPVTQADIRKFTRPTPVPLGRNKAAAQSQPLIDTNDVNSKIILSIAEFFFDKIRADKDTVQASNRTSPEPEQPQTSSEQIPTGFSQHSNARNSHNADPIAISLSMFPATVPVANPAARTATPSEPPAPTAAPAASQPSAPSATLHRAQFRPLNPL